MSKIDTRKRMKVGHNVCTVLFSYVVIAREKGETKESSLFHIKNKVINVQCIIAMFAATSN